MILIASLVIAMMMIALILIFVAPKPPDGGHK